MSTQVTISLSNGDRFGQYRVHAKCGSVDYVDFFNPANDWRRRVFAENVVSMLGWPDSTEQVNDIMWAVLEELQRTEKAQETPDERVKVECLDNLVTNTVDWLWPGRIAIGKLCVIAGDPGLGKSMLTLDIAAHASQGAPWPDGSGFAPVTSVLLLSAEDDFADTIRPRLVAAGADLKQIHAVQGVCWGQGEAETTRLLDIVQDVERLGERIEEVPPPRLLVIDPISSFLGAAGEYANAEIRKLLQPMTTLAQQTKTSVVLVSHLRKSKGSNLHRIIGSIAFAAVARSAFVLQRVKDMRGQQRRLIPVKSNLGGPRTALRFEVREHDTLQQPCIVWGEEELHDGITIPNEPIGRPPIDRSDVQKVIDGRLSKGPATLSELMELIEQADLVAVPRKSLERMIDAHYVWLEEKQGRERMIGPKPSQEFDGCGQKPLEGGSHERNGDGHQTD